MFVAHAGDPDQSPQQHLIRTSVDGVHVAVDFETLFLALGLAQWGAQQVCCLLFICVLAGTGMRLAQWGAQQVCCLFFVCYLVLA